MSQFLGKLLVASPLLDQTPFSRSVVFVFQDNEDATVGVILNQPADDQVKQAWSSIVGKSVESSLVSIGGPIPGPVVVIHRDRQAAEIELPNGVYTAASEDNIQYLANRSDGPFHVFFGLSGWQTGQLANEVERGAWLALPANKELLFRDSNDLQSEVLKSYEKHFIREVLGIRRLASNVMDN